MDVRQQIPDLIAEFIKSCQIASLCFLESRRIPWCFNCFYSFDPERQLLVFKSGEDSIHGSQLCAGVLIAGTIHSNPLQPANIQGVQFSGVIVSPDSYAEAPERIYQDRFPYSDQLTGRFFFVQLQYLKFTDNTRKFGEKVHWGSRN